MNTVGEKGRMHTVESFKELSITTINPFTNNSNNRALQLIASFQQCCRKKSEV